MIVDCDTCQVRGPACGDCVVTVLLGMPAPERPVELDDAERSAIGVLSGSGLVPPLRLVAGDAAAAHGATSRRSPGAPARPGAPVGPGAPPRPGPPGGRRESAPDPREAAGA